jgi:hypothetical protein
MWLLNSPLIYVPFALWHQVAENRAQHRRHQHLVLTPPALLNIVLILHSLCICKVLQAKETIIKCNFSNK